MAILLKTLNYLQMKNYLFLLFMIFTIGSLSAQKKLTEGVILMELTDIKSDDPSMAAMLGGMRGSTQEIVFNPEKQRSSMSMMGGLVNTTVFFDSKSNESRTYMDMMGNKIMIRTPTENQEENNDFNIQVDKSKTKKINGYNCHKVVMTPKTNEGQSMELIMYVTEEIAVISSVSSQFNTSAIKGTPLEMSINAEGMTMTFTCKKVDEKLPKDPFKEPTGYKEMTMEEFQKSMGNMGGFGF
jgi:hypothetical protein